MTHCGCPAPLLCTALICALQGPFDMEKIKSHCRAAWGVEPRAHHCPITYGGLDLRYASNIVLSNGRRKGPEMKEAWRIILRH